ncbi:hypothetical protein HKCCE4037_06335 [Rhodobacterales bacterium HKCCE4037]|nr:hypothetical protein [Rhodobacterales bacterium HKCCE4037]
MTAWAVAGQSLSLVVGGAGVGLAVGLGGLLWIERDRAGDLQDQLFAERMGHITTAAQLGTCEATRDALREGRQIDAEIPDDVGDFVLPDDWWMRPVPRPGPDD